MQVNVCNNSQRPNFQNEKRDESTRLQAADRKNEGRGLESLSKCKDASLAKNKGKISLVLHHNAAIYMTYFGIVFTESLIISALFVIK